MLVHADAADEGVLAGSVAEVGEEVGGKVGGGGDAVGEGIRN